MNLNINLLSQRLEKIEYRYLSKRKKHLRIHDDYSIEFLDSSGLIYRPSKSGKKFHASQKDEKYVMGPFGSGKSTMCCMEILHQVYNMPKCKDGKRYAKFAILRNTYKELQTGILKTYLDWMGKLGVVEFNKSQLCCNHTYDDGRGIVKLTVEFMACERNEDIDKFRSVEYTGVYFNEMCQFTLKMLTELQGRAGRYPKIISYDENELANLPENKGRNIPIDEYGNKKWYAPQVVLGDTNPPEIDHWLFKYFEENQYSEKFEFIKQPPGIIKNDKGKWENNIEADNYLFLGENYYLNIAHTGTEEFVKVYCLGEYGTVHDGKFVFEQYNDDFHSVNDITIIKNEPVYFGWDLALHPAFICCQFVHGQCRVIKEFYGDYCSVKELAQNYVIPWINTHLEDYIYYSYCDPSDSGSSADNLTCIKVLNELGIQTTKATTNRIIERLDSVKDFLNRMVNGKPAFIISRTGCPVLRRGFLGAYQFKRVNIISKDKYQDIPNKENPIADVQDALQYAILGINYRVNLPSKRNSISFIERGKYI